jgi:23S rRNA (guanosine2251-2'-O)-methyltransferase
MEQIEGRNQVLVGLRRNVIDTVYLSESAHGQVIEDIVYQATNNLVDLRYVNKYEVDKMSKTKNNQGVIGILKTWDYTNLNELLMKLEKKENPFVLVLDHLKDPHNLGAIMRTADAAGVDGIIIPKDRSVDMNETVMRVSVGAALTVPLVKVTNLSQTIDVLKEEGFWIMGTDAEAKKHVYDVDLNLPLAVLIGSEGKGLSNNLVKKSDFLVKLPMLGVISSLNASVAAGVIMYEVVRQRDK